MQGPPNRMGLGMRGPMQTYGQGPPIGSLPPSNGAYHPPPMAATTNVSSGPMQKATTLFVGSISAGIPDSFLSSLFSACGTLRSFKRLTTAAGKPQAFGFAEFEEPDALSRALSLLNGLELPALEEGQPNKKLLVKADDKTKVYLEGFEAQRMKTDADDNMSQMCETLIQSILDSLRSGAPLPDTNSLSPSSASKPMRLPGVQQGPFTIPPHLQDLQEADLPENQRGLITSEIALFRERAAKREKEKSLVERDKAANRSAGVGGFQGAGAMGIVPSGPKERVWGRQNSNTQTGHNGPQSQQQPHHQQQSPQQGWGKGSQSYQKPVNFVQGQDAFPGEGSRGVTDKTDEELEKDRREARRREEDNSFRDRERRYESREKTRIMGIDRTLKRQRAAEKHQEEDRDALSKSLREWDDDESDETFYTDRVRWRMKRSKALHAEQKSDEASHALEARQAEHLRQESEAFLARQMDEMRSLAEEQRKAGLLLDDGAPIKLSISTSAPAPAANAPSASGDVKPPVAAGLPGVFGVEDDEDVTRRRKGPLVKLDFGGFDSGEAKSARLNKAKDGISKDKEVLWKAKIRWEALSDRLIDTKIEKFTKRKMTDYLGELDDDDLIMFVVEHLKDHKGPAKLVEGLEPVLVEEAEEFVVSLWRQVVFESAAYAEGLETGETLVDQ